MPFTWHKTIIIVKTSSIFMSTTFTVRFNSNIKRIKEIFYMVWNEKKKEWSVTISRKMDFAAIFVENFHTMFGQYLMAHMFPKD